MDGDEQTRNRIREAAYLKWERAGRPQDKDDEYWLEAERELTGQASRDDQARRMSHSNDATTHGDRATAQESIECDVVQVASEESFPASDAPAWVGRA